MRRTDTCGTGPTSTEGSKDTTLQLNLTLLRPSTVETLHHSESTLPLPPRVCSPNHGSILLLLWSEGETVHFCVSLPSTDVPTFFRVSSVPETTEQLEHEGREVLTLFLYRVRIRWVRHHKKLS